VGSSRVAGLLIGAVCALGILNAGPIYSVYPIQDTPAGWSKTWPAISHVFDLNNLGQVAGYGWNGSIPQAFIGTTSGSTAIPLPPGWSEAYGFGINDSGQVAGYGLNGSTKQAFIGTTSGSTAIPLPTGWESARAWGINNSGQVAGDGWNGSAGQAFIGTTSGSTPIPLPPGWESASGQSINNSGQVAGFGWDGDTVQAFIGTTSGSTAIPLPAGWSAAYGWGINDSGQVAGDRGPGGELAFIGSTSGSTPIPTNPDWYSVRVPLNLLNNAGQVIGVGYGFLTGGGWVWDSVNGVRELNDLVPAEWSVGDPMSINDRGQILAYGSNSQTLYSGPVLLDPIPEPTTGVLLGGGLILLAALARRRGHK